MLFFIFCRISPAHVSVNPPEPQDLHDVIRNRHAYVVAQPRLSLCIFSWVITMSSQHVCVSQRTLITKQRLPVCFSYQTACSSLIPDVTLCRTPFTALPPCCFCGARGDQIMQADMYLCPNSETGAAVSTAAMLLVT